MVAQQAAGAERMRIIVDTDIENEMDDQFALAYTLFNSDVFEVEGVTTNSKHQWEVQPFYREALRIVHLCASTAPVHIGAYMTYDRIKADINKSTFDGHAAVNFIIERAHAKDPGGRPLYVMTLGKVTNLALALLKDPTIAPKIRAVTLMTRFPASLEPDADWTVSESNSLDDRYATAALLENAALELHIVPWPGWWREATNTLDPRIQEIYDIMPGLGPKVDPIVYIDRYGKNHGTLTCFGDFAIAIFKELEYVLITHYGANPAIVRTYPRPLLDVGAPMVLKNPSYAVSTVMGAPRWDGTPSWTGSANEEPGKWILNPNNPRKVTVWNRLHLKHDLVMADFWNTFRNPVIESPTIPTTSGTLGLEDGSGTRQQGDSLDATRFVAGSSFSANTMHARFTDNTASGVMRMAIYADNDGVPGAVLGDTAEFSIGSGLRSAALKTPVDIKEGSVYWIATWVQRGSTSNVTFVANDGAGTRVRAEPAYSATTSFPGGSTLSHSANVTYAVFATGTED
jgi:hypothetical protein